MPKLNRTKQNSSRNPYAIDTPPPELQLPRIDYDFLKSYDLFRQPISLMLDKKQRDQKHLKRYMQDFGTWFGVCVTFLVCILSLVIFALAIDRKISGVDDSYKTFNMLTPPETLVDAKAQGFMTSIEIMQVDESATLDIFEKGIPNLKNLRKHIDIVLSLKSSKGHLLYEMRQCDTNDFRNLSPTLPLSTIHKRLCINHSENTNLNLKIQDDQNFSIQIRKTATSSAADIDTFLSKIYFK